MSYRKSLKELTKVEDRYKKARHKFETRKHDILDYLLTRPQGTCVVELAKGIGMSLSSVERYVAKLKEAGDIELSRAEPIKGVSKRPVKYYVVSTQGELDGLLKKSNNSA